MANDNHTNNNDQDILTPSDLGKKLVVALRSVSDPQAIMQAIADRTAVNLRSELDIKINSIERATTLWHDDLVRVPTDVDKAVSSVRDILEQIILKSKSEVHDELGNRISVNTGEIGKLNGILCEHQKAVTIAFDAQKERLDTQTKLVGEMVQGRVATLAEVSEERFKSIQTQFTLLKQATEQLDLANKTAIAAALQAQKESAGETQKSSQAAIAKSENSTSEAIKALTTTFNVAIAGLTDRYNDLKSRLDRGEGKSSVNDPASVEAFRMLFARERELSQNMSINNGRTNGLTEADIAKARSMGMIFGFVGMGVGVLTLALLAFRVVT